MPRKSVAKQSMVRRPRRAAKAAKRTTQVVSASKSRISVNFLPTTQSPTPLSSSYQFGSCTSRFSSSNGLLIKGTQPLTMIGKGGVNPTQDVSALYNRAGSLLYSAPLNPFEADWVGGVLEMISSPFVRFRFRKLRFHYRPVNTSTDTTLGLSFVYSADPQHPLLAPTPAASVPVTTILDAGGFSFAAWQPWDYDAILAQVDELYFVAATGTLTRADIRQAFQGLAVCSFNMTNAAAGYAIGQLWVSYELELYDPSPTVAGVSLLENQDEKFVEDGHSDRVVKRRKPFSQLVVAVGEEKDDYVAIREPHVSPAQSLRAGFSFTDEKPRLKRQ